MIQIICRDQKISYTAYHLVRAFFPQEAAKITVSETETAENVRILAEDGQDLWIEAADPETFYQKLSLHTGKELPWGMLTGVRPVKLASAWLAEHAGKELSRQEAKDAFIRHFQDTRFVSEKKAGLAFDIAWKEQALVLEKGLNKDGASLYAGIPFCPSVCRYCSFSSGPIDRYAGQVDEYLRVLVREMRARKQMYFASGKYPDTIYVGGGTPTSLSEEQLEYLLDEMEQIFSIRQGAAEGHVKEYTVEAGRPDSITRGKLKILKDHGVNRISVNPQTMNPRTLELIGRAHSPEQTRQAFFLAREEGFDNINMDLIMGLAGETAEDVRRTLEEIEVLMPDSLTVHTLAIKRASAIGIDRRIHLSEETQSEHNGSQVETMITDAYHKAGAMGMEPYYLYRQKMITGNFENIGYALPGKECLYNILIMEELQSIIACGAGAVTKIIRDEPAADPSRGGKLRKITRQENVKNIEEYIRRGTC